MPNQKRTKTVDKGIFLLHSFAWGAILEKLHGDEEYREKVKKYLESQDSGMEAELKKLAPEKLIIAWDYLKKESRKRKTDPFNFQLIKEYVFKRHNLIVPEDCAIKKAGITKIDRKKQIIKARDDSGKKILVNYLDCLLGDLKEGDIIAVHYGWLVVKSS